MMRTVLATGGADGIGWTTAQMFASRGDKIVIADLDAEKSRSRARELGEGHVGVRCDVTSEDAATGAIAEALGKTGRLDVLVNNAGIGDTSSPTFQQTAEHFRRVLDVHLSGTFLMSRIAGEAMAARDGGAIVN